MIILNSFIFFLNKLYLENITYYIIFQQFFLLLKFENFLLKKEFTKYLFKIPIYNLIKKVIILFYKNLKLKKA